jgi:hypothetical protein
MNLQSVCQGYFAPQGDIALPSTVTVGQAVNEMSVFLLRVLSGVLENSHYVAIFPINSLLKLNMPKM